jgi:hypothetical protein
MACEHCGRSGLDYQGYVFPARRQRGPGGYRAFAVCPGCGQAREF